MLRLLMSATTHLVFDSDALPQAGALVAQVTSGGPSILLAHGIPSADVDEVLRKHYTQYFPHEHLDATPLPPGQVAGLQDRPEFDVGPRNLLAYLQRDLLYLSEQLSSLEATWRTPPARGGIAPPEPHNHLAKLGHIPL